MQKTFCDICGKEIDGITYSMSLKLKESDFSKDKSNPYTTTYWYDNEFNLDNKDICLDCAKKIYNLIKT